MIKKSDIDFRLLAHEVNTGIYVSDPEGEFIYANLTLADIFGCERPIEMMRKKFTDFISRDSVEMFTDQFRKSLVSGTGATVISTKIIKPDGRASYIEVRSMPFIKNNTLLGSQGVVHDITNYRRIENNLKNTSTHDPLTGIYNRTFFEAESKRLERGRQFPISIIMVNMGIGESEDYEGRDKLIKRVAHQLFYTFRGDDIVARIGENEFAILLPGVAEHTAHEIIKRVQDDLQKINTAAGAPPIAFFIGISTARKGDKLASMLKQAKAIADLKKKQ